MRPWCGGGITSDEEEEQLEALNDWVEAQGLPRGVIGYRLRRSGHRRAEGRVRPGVAQGIQEELSQPVAVLLNEEATMVAIASQAGFRCFTAVESFKVYVRAEVLAEATG